jgi:transposase
MKANFKEIRKHRNFSEGFKRQLVSEFESGKYSVGQLEKLHGISNSLIYRWIYKYSKFNEKGYRIIEMKKSSTQKVKEMEKRIADLERALGQKQIKIDYLEKMIDIAMDEFKIDIKKNFNTPPSGGSDKTNQI